MHSKCTWERLISDENRKNPTSSPDNFNLTISLNILNASSKRENII